MERPACCGRYTNPTGAGAATRVTAPQTEEANQGSFPELKAGLRQTETPVIARRKADNGGAVSSGAGGWNSADQRKREGEEEADEETDFSVSQEAERDLTSHASGEAWQSQVRAGCREKGHKREREVGRRKEETPRGSRRSGEDRN
ncbi:hypothetical protein NDU88_011083 [Pleurodeles waltl]|uniref:Uncharacterized protein n=1 Tax=Pleurodeles waltl TaxID=8319 RepID=A0AAV7QXL5_PLEWA|nr:hypothetical protein NDU88_011083 [Pleurodeles waltl]